MIADSIIGYVRNPRWAGLKVQPNVYGTLDALVGVSYALDVQARLREALRVR